MEFRLSFAHNYQWSKCGKCFNVKTNRQIKQTYKNRCIGYYIKGKFYSLTKLRKHLEEIPKEEYCPF